MTAFVGTSGADQITGSDGADLIFGGSASAGGVSPGDTINGGGGDDILIGSDGADTLDGGNGSDVLIGGSGADIITLGEGDLAVGGEGADIFHLAGGQIQVVVGGAGADTLSIDSDWAVSVAVVTIAGLDDETAALLDVDKLREAAGADIVLVNVGADDRIIFNGQLLGAASYGLILHQEAIEQYAFDHESFPTSFTNGGAAYLAAETAGPRLRILSPTT